MASPWLPLVRTCVYTPMLNVSIGRGHVLTT